MTKYFVVQLSESVCALRLSRRIKFPKRLILHQEINARVEPLRGEFVSRHSTGFNNSSFIQVTIDSDRASETIAYEFMPKSLLLTFLLLYELNLRCKVYRLETFLLYNNNKVVVVNDREQKYVSSDIWFRVTSPCHTQA